ncbi:MAG: exodeoxyribonuclease III [Candidatus Moranbacteria bacterium]|nr:exodeoxyribonuclease III [Candidatus Moranbacteria bacterium]
MKLITWNVNGLRAILKKGFEKQVLAVAPDVICVQETKSNQNLLLPVIDGYQEFWSHGAKAGYAGTLILVRDKIEVKQRIEPPKFLVDEGRLVVLELDKFYLLNCYFPNGGMGEIRLAYKKKYYDEFLQYVKELEQKKPVIFGGDVNTAHQEIDLARPKANEKNTGFLPWERAWLDQVVGNNLVDVWRAFHPGEIAYSWWDYKTRARERNVGWRIDYFFCSKILIKSIESCKILTQFLGSDHVPIELVITD